MTDPARTFPDMPGVDGEARRWQWVPAPVRHAGSWLADRWVQWWWIDVPVAAVVVLLIMWIPGVYPVVDLLGHLKLADRRSIYTDLLTIATLFAGFSTLATATYLGWSSRGVRAVQNLVGQDLIRLWLSATTMPWVCALVLVVVKMVDRGSPPTNPTRWIAVGTLIVVGEQLARVIYLFYSLAMIEQRNNNRKPVRPVAALPIGMKQKANGG